MIEQNEKTKQQAEYIITEKGMNLAIAVLKENKLYDEAESVLNEIRPVPAHSIKPTGCLCAYCEETAKECKERHNQSKIDEAEIKTAAYAEGFNDGQQTGCGARDAAIRRQAQEEEREKTRLETIYELLKFFKFSCPGGPVTPVCDMCGAAGYCAELRDKEKKEGPA